MSRMAIQARPMLARAMFFAASAISATMDSVSRYLLAGVSMAMPNTCIGGAEITPELL
ncbi:hypothetical protein D3C86_2125490 [compost metagenome]